MKLQIIEINPNYITGTVFSSLGSDDLFQALVPVKSILAETLVAEFLCPNLK